MSEKLQRLPVVFSVNGNEVRVHPEQHVNLLAFLRNELRLTGSKLGCATGHCGACSVLINDHTAQSCQVSVSAAKNTKVHTIEHVAQTELGARIIASLMQYDAAQCGYCLPGIVVAAYQELRSASTPDLAHALQGNLCRCGTHARILQALQAVSTTHSTPA